MGTEKKIISNKKKKRYFKLGLGFLNLCTGLSKQNVQPKDKKSLMFWKSLYVVISENDKVIWGTERTNKSLTRHLKPIILGVQTPPI